MMVRTMAFILLLPATFAAFLWAARAEDGWRDRFLRAVVAFGLSVVIVTEMLSAFGWLRRGPTIGAWSVALLVTAGRAWFARRSAPWRGLRRSRDVVVLVTLAGCFAIVVTTWVAAAFSPPNSTDAMAYHMPRVIYWAEQASLRFFPTPYLTQIMLQPMAEYWMLNGYLLSGSDHFVNFGQWFAALACMIGVSAVAREFGARMRGQAIAALFCATLPAGILAASGAKNDYVMAMFAVAAVYFALRWRNGRRVIDAWFLGVAVGLALFTKATAYLFLPFPIAAILFPIWREWRQITKLALMILVCGLAVNGAHYWRNWELSGSPLGFDSAQGDGLFRWRNESFGWRQTVSNMLRHASEQMGARSDRWNQGVYRFVLAAHRDLGMDVNDPVTTERWTVFEAPRNANHETNANNRWHLLLLAVVSGFLLWRDRHRAIYALSPVCGFVAFCAYLKWAPFTARYQLPLFVLAAPLAAAIEEFGWRWLRPVWIELAVCIFLLSGARPPALQNWVRPLEGPRSVLRVARDDQYFADMTYWDNRASYYASVAAIKRSGCGTIGIDINNFQLEYPLQALVRENRPDARFAHTGVENGSRRYAPSVAEPPCAIVCLDCLGDDARLKLYRDFRTEVTAGKFVVLLDRP